MSEQETTVTASSESNASGASSASEDRPAETGPPVGDCQSPPLAPQPPRDELPDPRMRLLQLAAELARSRNRRVLAEFLRLRRAV